MFLNSLVPVIRPAVVVPFGLVAVPAINRSVTIGLKRQFGNFRSATGAGPITLNHRPGTKVASVIHCFDLTDFDWTLHLSLATSVKKLFLLFKLALK